MKNHKRNSRSALEISYPQFITKNNENTQMHQRNSNGDSLPSSPTRASLSPPKGFHSRFPKCTPCLKNNKNENKIQAQQQTFNKQRRQSLQYIYQTRQQQQPELNRRTSQITGNPGVVERRYSYDQFGRLVQTSASSPHSGQFKKYTHS